MLFVGKIASPRSHPSRSFHAKRRGKEQDERNSIQSFLLRSRDHFLSKLPQGRRGSGSSSGGGIFGFSPLICVIQSKLVYLIFSVMSERGVFGLIFFENKICCISMPQPNQSKLISPTTEELVVMRAFPKTPIPHPPDHSWTWESSLGAWRASSSWWD